MSFETFREGAGGVCVRVCVCKSKWLRQWMAEQNTGVDSIQCECCYDGLWMGEIIKGTIITGNKLVTSKKKSKWSKNNNNNDGANGGIADGNYMLTRI